MQIVQVVAAIAAPEHVNSPIVRICSVHVAWAGWLARRRVIEPSLLIDFEHVKIVSCQRTLTQPAADDVQFVVYFKKGDQQVSIVS